MSLLDFPVPQGVPGSCGPGPRPSPRGLAAFSGAANLNRRERVWIGDPGPCVVGRDPHPLVTRWLGLVARRPLAFWALARAAGGSGASRGGTRFAPPVGSWGVGG